MLDLNSLSIPGGVIVAGIAWATVSGFVLGPIVAERTIEISGWQKICEAKLRSSIVARVPPVQSKPNIGCGDVLKLFGNGADQLCNQGGNEFFKLLTIDPLARQKEQLRQRKLEKLSRIAELAPSRCTCAASIVESDRVLWGVFAGSARLIGGPKNLQSDLTQALHGQDCSKLAEG